MSQNEEKYEGDPLCFLAGTVPTALWWWFGGWQAAFAWFALIGWLFLWKGIKCTPADRVRNPAEHLDACSNRDPGQP